MVIDRPTDKPFFESKNAASNSRFHRSALTSLLRPQGLSRDYELLGCFRLSVAPSVGAYVMLCLFGQLGATHVVYAALYNTRPIRPTMRTHDDKMIEIRLVYLLLKLFARK